MARSVVITGIGLVTPLGRSPREILERIRRGEVAASKPPFDIASLACPFCASIPDFDAEQYFRENKTLRLMNRGCADGGCCSPSCYEGCRCKGR